MSSQSINNVSKKELLEQLEEERNKNLKLQSELKKMRERETNVFSGLRSSRIGLWEWDLKEASLRIDMEGLAPLGMFGDTSGVGWSFKELVHPDDRIKPREIIRSYQKAHPKACEYEFRIRDKTGKYKWLRSVGSITKRGEQGRLAKISGIFQDISETTFAQNELKAIENRYDLLADMIQEGILIHRKGVILDANKAACRITGFSRKDFEGKHLFSFLDTRTKKQLKGKLTPNTNHKINGKTKSGQNVTWEAVIRDYDNDRGVIIFNDITAREKAEKDLLKQKKTLETEVRQRTKEIKTQNEVLAQREERFRSLIYNLQGMAYRYLNDGKWSTEFVSDGSTELTGHKPIEFVEGRVKMETHVVNKEYASNVWDQILTAMDKKESFKVAYPIKTALGQEKWVLDRGLGVYNKKGDLIKLEGVIIDITEQKKKEIQLELAQFTIDKAPVAIEWVKEDGSFFYVNEQRRKSSGYSQKDFQSKKIYNLAHNLGQKDWETAFKKRQRSGVKDMEVTYKRKDGSTYPALISASNIKFGDTVYNCAYIHDITELKKTENKLKEAYDEISATEEELRQHSEALILLNGNLEAQKNKLEHTVTELKSTQKQLVQAEKMASLGVLVAGIAHELNNPINYISSGSDALRVILGDLIPLISYYDTVNESNAKEKLVEIENYKEAIGFKQMINELNVMMDNIDNGVKKSTTIIKGLKTFSRSDKGTLERYDIHQIIDDALLILYNSYKYKVEVHKEYGDLPKIDCYPNKLNQVFLNILSNSIQSIDNEGDIYIKTAFSSKHDDVFIVVTIQDTGVGIPKEMQTRIFEPFYTTKEPGKGTGLGLAISLGILEDHAGGIELESGIGMGTKFDIFLPIKLSELIN